MIDTTQITQSGFNKRLMNSLIELEHHIKNIKPENILYFTQEVLEYDTVLYAISQAYNYIFSDVGTLNGFDLSRIKRIIQYLQTGQLRFQLIIPKESIQLKADKSETKIIMPDYFDGRNSFVHYQYQLIYAQDGGLVYINKFTPIELNNKLFRAFTPNGEYNGKSLLEGDFSSFTTKNANEVLISTVFPDGTLNSGNSYKIKYDYSLDGTTQFESTINIMYRCLVWRFI